jgi:hypothetical protein
VNHHVTPCWCLCGSGGDAMRGGPEVVKTEPLCVCVCVCETGSANCGNKGKHIPCERI